MKKIEERKSKEYYDGRFAHDYKSAVEQEVTTLLAMVNTYGEPPKVEERIEMIERIFDAYVEQTGEVPDGNQVQRLANWILLDELTDPRPDKVAKEDYPIMTKRQLRTRHNREMANEHIPETLANTKSTTAKKRRTTNLGDI